VARKDLSLTDLITLPCDNCGAETFSIRYPSTLNHKLCDSDFTVFGELGEYPQIVTCSACHLTYASPRDEGKSLIAKYNEMSVNEYLVAEASRRLITERDARFVKRLMNVPGRVLDIGCSAGLFLASLGTGWAKFGIEPSRAASEAARQRVPDAQIENAAVFEADLGGETFNLITMWDVIEHLDSPKAALNHIHGLLADQGRLVLVTPDIGSLTARVMGRRWPHLIRGHLYYYDTKSMQRLAKDTGFEIVSFSRYTRFFKVSYILRRIGLIANEERMAARLGRLNLTVPIATGDSMQVVLKKANAS